MGLTRQGANEIYHVREYSKRRFTDLGSRDFSIFSIKRVAGCRCAQSLLNKLVLRMEESPGITEQSAG